MCNLVGVSDVCTDFTNIIKVDVDVDVNEMSLLCNMRQLCTCSLLSFFKAVCVYFVDKNVDQDQKCSFCLIYFQH